eukprot:400373-Rhodomonas_salina.1
MENYFNFNDNTNIYGGETDTFGGNDAEGVRTRSRGHHLEGELADFSSLMPGTDTANMFMFPVQRLLARNQDDAHGSRSNAASSGGCARSAGNEKPTDSRILSTTFQPVMQAVGRVEGMKNAKSAVHSHLAMIAAGA